MKPSNTVKKWAKDLKRHLTKPPTQKNNKQNREEISKWEDVQTHVIRELKIKTKMRHH